MALANRRYGYRRIAAQLRRDGLVANHKRVLRLMRRDNLLCLRERPFVPVTTDSRHEWRVVPNLTRGLMSTGLDQLWVAGYYGRDAAHRGDRVADACDVELLAGQQEDHLVAKLLLDLDVAFVGDGVLGGAFFIAHLDWLATRVFPDAFEDVGQPLPTCVHHPRLFECGKEIGRSCYG